MSCYDLDLWPLDLELLSSFGRHVFKLCVKFEQNRTIHCRVIDDLAHYRRKIFEGVVFTRKDLRGAWTELHQTWRGHTSIISAHRVCSELRYLAAFSNAGRSKSSDVENNAKFSTFWPPSVKIRGVVGEISGSWFKALSMTEPRV